MPPHRGRVPAVAEALEAVASLQARSWGGSVPAHQASWKGAHSPHCRRLLSAGPESEACGAGPACRVMGEPGSLQGSVEGTPEALPPCVLGLAAIQL